MGKLWRGCEAGRVYGARSGDISSPNSGGWHWPAWARISVAWAGLERAARTVKSRSTSACGPTWTALPRVFVALVGRWRRMSGMIFVHLRIRAMLHKRVSRRSSVIGYERVQEDVSWRSCGRFKMAEGGLRHRGGGAVLRSRKALQL